MNYVKVLCNVEDKVSFFPPPPKATNLQNMVAGGRMIWRWSVAVTVSLSQNPGPFVECAISRNVPSQCKWVSEYSLPLNTHLLMQHCLASDDFVLMFFTFCCFFWIRTALYFYKVITLGITYDVMWNGEISNIKI